MQKDFSNNEEVLATFAKSYDDIRRDGSISSISMVIRGSASIEGNSIKSLSLAGGRARALADYLVAAYSVPDSIIRVEQESFLAVEAESVLATYPDSLPGLNLGAIRKIAHSVNGLNMKQAFKALDGRFDGPNWTWFKNNVLEPTRFAEISLSFVREIPEAEDIVVPVPVPVPVDTAVVMTVAETPVQEPEPAQEPLRHEFRIGTNLLYDVATVANLSFEAGFAGHWAVNFLVTCSPWDIRRPDIKLRTLLLQPEVRRYFADDFKGHYLGIEGHYGWYNVALAGKNRYQDKDANTPLWGAGISYGYVLAFNRHWGMDFSVSAGYARLVYDGFYNIENGAWHMVDSRDWWGPTKIGVSIYYQF